MEVAFALDLTQATFIQNINNSCTRMKSRCAFTITIITITITIIIVQENASFFDTDQYFAKTSFRLSNKNTSTQVPSRNLVWLVHKNYLQANKHYLEIRKYITYNSSCNLSISNRNLWCKTCKIALFIYAKPL